MSRITSLDAILASSEPERANAMLLDNPLIQVDEVTLRAPANVDQFEKLMRSFRLSD